jgi:heme/copper-type cytochrome/quinol oxidase subunit 3
MTDITPFDAIPIDAVPAEPARPRLLLLGTSLAGSAVVVGYAGLVGHYLSQRAAAVAAGEPWLPESVDIPLTQPNFMLLTLAFSVVSVLWATSSVRNEDRSNAYIAFGLTLMFGFAQIVQTSYLLTLLEMPGSSEPAALAYALIGIQLALIGVAMAYVAVMALRTVGGGYSARDYEGVLSAAIFWIMSVGVYAALWYAVYITK